MVQIQQVVIPITAGSSLDDSAFTGEDWQAAALTQIEAVRALGFICAGQAYFSSDVIDRMYGEGTIQPPGEGDPSYRQIADYGGGALAIYVDFSLPPNTMRLGRAY